MQRKEPYFAVQDIFSNKSVTSAHTCDDSCVRFWYNWSNQYWWFGFDRHHQSGWDFARSLTKPLRI